MSEALVIIDFTIVSIKSTTLRAEARPIMRLKSVSWIQFLAQVEAAAAGCQESSSAMFGKGTEAKPTRISGESSLGPLVIIRDCLLYTSDAADE